MTRMCAFAACREKAGEVYEVLCDGTAFYCCDSHHTAIATVTAELLIQDIYKKDRSILDFVALRDHDAFSREEVKFVYFMRRHDGYIKIGFSGDVEKRRKELERHFGPLDILHTEPGGYPREQTLHCQFAALRAEGEWFEPGDLLLEYINRLPVDKEELKSDFDDGPITLD